MANPPNCPELRPIERYWALVNRELKSTGKESKNMQDVKNKWNAATSTTSKVTDTTVKTQMEGIPEKLYKFCNNSNN